MPFIISRGAKGQFFESQEFSGGGGEGAAAVPQSSAEFAKANEYCFESPSNSCVTSYGTLIGSSEGVPAYSNCNVKCIRCNEEKNDFFWHRIPAESLGTQDGVISGVAWQCDEYAARWWLLKRGMTFGVVDTADTIWNIEEAHVPRSQSRIPLKRFANGGPVPPAQGDLLVYAADQSVPSLRFGHVAIVVDVNPQTGFVAIAEQNYENAPWDNPSAYARRLWLRVTKSHYEVFDTRSPAGRTDPAAPPPTRGVGTIVGWVRPSSDLT